CCLEDLEKIDLLIKGSFYQFVDMAFYQTVRMFIIRTEHDPVFMVMKEVNKCIKIFSRASFPYQYFHSCCQLILRLFPGKAFMVGSHTRRCILPGLFSCQSRGMPVNYFSIFFCDG